MIEIHRDIPKKNHSQSQLSNEVEDNVKKPLISYDKLSSNRLTHSLID